MLNSAAPTAHLHISLRDEALALFVTEHKQLFGLAHDLSFWARRRLFRTGRSQRAAGPAWHGAAMRDAPQSGAHRHGLPAALTHQHFPVVKPLGHYCTGRRAGALRKETSIFSNVFVLSDAVKRLNSGYLEQAKLWVCTLSTAAAIQLLNIEWDYVTAAWRPSDGTLINHFHLVPHIHVTIYNLLCKHVGSLLTRMCSRYGTGLSHVGQFTVYSWRRDGKIEVTQYIKLEILSKTVIPIMGYRCKPGMVLIGVLWCFKINSGKGRFYIIRWRVQAALHHNEILPVHISPVIMSQQA